MSEFRTYLQLEVALTRRLMKAWAELSDPIYREIEQAVADKNYDKARVLVNDLDMRKVGSENAQWIKYCLSALAVWGAGNVAGDGAQFLAQGAHHEVLDRLTQTTLLYLENNATADVRTDALQLIADAQGVVAQKFDVSPEQYRQFVDEDMYPEWADELKPLEKKEDFTAITDFFRQAAEKGLESYKYDLPDVYKPVAKTDIYKLRSSYHKAIRRGDRVEAMRTAAAAVKLDSYRTWSAMNTIAMEDIGMGDLTTVAFVLANSSNMELRKKVGEEKMLMYMVEQMCNATKDRLSDDVWCIAEYGKTGSHLVAAGEVAAKSEKELATDIFKSDSIAVKSMAMQRLFAQAKLNKDWSVFNEVVKNLYLPPLAEYVTLMGSYKGVDSLASVFPLTAYIAASSKVSAIKSTDIPVADRVMGIPVYGFDGFNRSGKSSLAYLAVADDKIREFFSENPVTNRADALGYALFTQESGLLNRQVVWEISEKLAEEVDEQEFINVGLTLEKGRKLEQLLKAAQHTMLLKARRRVTERENDERVAKEEAKLKYKFGTTQLDLPFDSVAHKEMESLRSEIPKHHLMGDGKDIGVNHVTVRYGLKDQQLDGVRKYIKSLSPFTAYLGKAITFPPSEHSDNAMPLVLEVDAPELHDIHEEMAKHGNFKPDDFDYKPHATLAYIDPKFEDVYSDFDAKQAHFPVLGITIRHRDGSAEYVPFEGGVAQKADYLKPLVSFQKSGNDALQLIASLNSNRIATWGFVAECDVRGVTEYAMKVIEDSRTCKFCRLVDEEHRIFRVEDARKLVNTALSQTDPDALTTIQPWPSQSADAIESFRKMDTNELVAQGLQIGPYHPGCRCHPKIVSQAVSKPEPVPVDNPTLPPAISTKDQFAELGYPVTQEQVDHWNAAMGVNPVDLLAELSGLPGKDVLEGKLESLFSFGAKGDISASTVVGDGENSVDHGFTFDPTTDKMYLDKSVITGDEAAGLSQSLNSMLNIGQSIGANQVVVEAEESAPQLGKLGFVPTPLDWQYIRQDALDALNGEYRDAYKALDPDQQQLLFALLSNNDEEGFATISQLPWDFGVETVGEALFGDVKGKLSLDLSNQSKVDAAQSYLSPDTVQKGDPYHDASGEFTSKEKVTAQLTPEEKEKAHMALGKLSPLGGEYLDRMGKSFEGKNVSAAEVFGKPHVHVMWDVKPSKERSYGSVEKFPVDQLTPAQEHIPIEGLKKYIDQLPVAEDVEGKSKEYLPHVLTYKGRNFVTAGHTRIGAQILAGRSHVLVRHYYMDDSQELIKPVKGK